jgi:hypothetical protein
MRLVVFSHTFNGKLFWCASVKQLGSSFRVFFSNESFYATDQIGIEPVEAHHVVIGQEAFDSRRFQNGLCNRGFRQVSIPANDYRLYRIVAAVIVILRVERFIAGWNSSLRQFSS